MRQSEVQSKRKRKTIKMLALTVFFFAVTWAPINIYHMLTHFSLLRHSSSAILCCHLIAMTSSCVNPFIYFGLNEIFHREIMKWLHCFRQSPSVHPGIEVTGRLVRLDRGVNNNANNTNSNNGNQYPVQQVTSFGGVMAHTTGFNSPGRQLKTCRNLKKSNKDDRYKGGTNLSHFLAVESEHCLLDLNNMGSNNALSDDMEDSNEYSLVLLSERLLASNNNINSSSSSNSNNFHCVDSQP